jgi:hypothetical protein
LGDFREGERLQKSLPFWSRTLYPEIYEHFLRFIDKPNKLDKEEVWEKIRSFLKAKIKK